MVPAKSSASLAPLHRRARSGGVEAGRLPGGCRRAMSAGALLLMGGVGARQAARECHRAPRAGRLLLMGEAVYPSGDRRSRSGGGQHFTPASLQRGRRAEERAVGRKALLPSRLPAAGEKPLPGRAPALSAHRPRSLWEEPARRPPPGKRRADAQGQGAPPARRCPA